MNENSGAWIPVPRPELAEMAPTNATHDEPRAAEPIGDGSAPSRPAAVLRRVRKRATLMRRRSMPLLGGTLLAVFLAAGG